MKTDGGDENTAQFANRPRSLRLSVAAEAASRRRSVARGASHKEHGPQTRTAVVSSPTVAEDLDGSGARLFGLVDERTEVRKCALGEQIGMAVDLLLHGQRQDAA